MPYREKEKNTEFYLQKRTKHIEENSASLKWQCLIPLHIFGTLILPSSSSTSYNFILSVVCFSFRGHHFLYSFLAAISPHCLPIYTIFIPQSTLESESKEFWVRSCLLLVWLICEASERITSVAIGLFSLKLKWNSPVWGTDCVFQLEFELPSTLPWVSPADIGFEFEIQTVIQKLTV